MINLLQSTTLGEEPIMTPQQSNEETAADDASAVSNNNTPSVDDIAEETFVGDVEAVGSVNNDEPIDEEATADETKDIDAMDEEQVMPDEIESSRSNICASRSADSHNNETDLSHSNPTNRQASDILASRSNESPAASTKLAEMMLHRIESIDVIRNLVQNELEQDSALIAEFTEQVLALEKELTARENEMEGLTAVKNEMQVKLTELEAKSEANDEQHSALTAQIDALLDQNATLEQSNAELLQMKQSIKPTLRRNEQMEEIISSITTSLKDCKKALERELKYAAALEKEKERTLAHKAKMAETHESEIAAYKKRLDEAHQGQSQLRKEMDDLRHVLCQEQLVNTKMTAVQNNLQAAEQSIIRLNAEKQVLIEEVAKINKEKEEMELMMEKKVDPVRVLQKELEVLRDKMGEMQMENTQLIGLQARLDETEKCLKTVLTEKNHLKAALGEQSSFELNPSHSIESRQDTTNTNNWLMEKKSFERRVADSEQALVLLAKENEELQTKIDKMTQENTALKTQTEPETEQEDIQDKLTTELGTLKLSYAKEKKRMMARQQELEELLVEALQKNFGGEEDGIEIVKRLKEVQLEIGAKKNVVAE